MSLARLKRLQRLEARQPRGKPSLDPFPLLMALWAAFTFQAEHAATKAGREFSRVPRRKPAEPWPEATQDALERAMAEYDSIARRLATAVDPASPYSARRPRQG